MDCRMLGFPVLHNLPEFVKFMFTESVKPCNYLIFCHHLLLLPSIYPSIRIFSNKLALRITWPKYWSFSISLPMNIQDWFPLTLTGLISLQSKGLSRVFSNHSSKISILWHSAFFIVQLSHSYMTTGKTIALTRRTFVDKVSVPRTLLFWDSTKRMLLLPA